MAFVLSLETFALGGLKLPFRLGSPEANAVLDRFGLRLASSHFFPDPSEIHDLAHIEPRKRPGSPETIPIPIFTTAGGVPLHPLVSIGQQNTRSRAKLWQVEGRVSATRYRCQTILPVRPAHGGTTAVLEAIPAA